MGNMCIKPAKTLTKKKGDVNGGRGNQPVGITTRRGDQPDEVTRQQNQRTEGDDCISRQDMVTENLEPVNDDDGNLDTSLEENETLRRRQLEELQEKVVKLQKDLEAARSRTKKIEVAELQSVGQLNMVECTHDEFQKIAHLRQECVTYESQIKRQNMEIEELKTRLSRIMSQRVTDNNPEITDLSDQNRPTNLADRYAELYSNEWSDAFEQLVADGKRKNKQIIRILLNVLTRIYLECRKRADDDLKTLQKTVATFSGTSELADDMKVALKQFKDSRKVNFLTKMPSFTECPDVISTKVIPMNERKDAIVKYITLATELCWLMSIQDPPVFMQTNFTKGEQFNKDVYNEYMATGRKNRYLVWPPLYLFEGGQLLRKGVGQTKQKKQEISFKKDKRRRRDDFHCM